jgi:hypothetical protein
VSIFRWLEELVAVAWTQQALSSSSARFSIDGFVSWRMNHLLIISGLKGTDVVVS